MKRYILICMIFLVVVLPLSAQIGANRDPEGPFWSPTDEQYAEWRVIDGVEEGAEIVFWPWALTPDFDEYLNQVIANFEATYPEVNVIMEGQPAAGARDNIRAAFASGDAPDVINLSDSWVPEFAEAGVLMNMDEAIGAAYPEIREQYVDGAWTKVAYDGTTYHIPWYLSLSNVMAYNSDILEELGYTEEDIPTTWEEAYEFAARVREDSGGAYYAFSLPIGEPGGFGILNTFYGEGIPLYNEDRSEVVFNTPESAAILQKWVELVQNDLIPRGSLTDDVREMINRYSEGEILLLQTGPQLFRLIEENNPDVFASLQLVPGLSGAANITNIGGVQTLVIPAESEYPNAALAFAVFLTNADSQTAFAQEVNIFSSNLESYDAPFFQTPGEDLASQVRPLAREYFTSAEAINISFPQQAEVELIVSYETQAALLGDKTPEQAVTDMQRRINDILAAEAE